MKKNVSKLQLKKIKISNLSVVHGGLNNLIDIPSEDRSLGCSLPPRCHLTDHPTFAYTCV